MKKILSIAVVSLAVAAVADTTFSPQIGVTTLNLTRKNNIIPVQFTSLAGSGSVTAAALVCTNNIPLGSHLYIYQNNAYTAWTLEPSGWSPLDISSTEDDDGVSNPGVPAGDQVLAVGSAIWLSLNGITSATVSFYGKVASSMSSTIEAGKCNLLANPTGASVNVLGKLSGMANGDQIRVVGDSPEVLFWSDTDEKWKKQSAGTTIGFENVDNLSVPAHGGFWYYSKGSSNITINW